MNLDSLSDAKNRLERHRSFPNQYRRGIEGFYGMRFCGLGFHVITKASAGFGSHWFPLGTKRRHSVAVSSMRFYGGGIRQTLDKTEGRYSSHLRFIWRR